jgi:hypothetical protein
MNSSGLKIFHEDYVCASLAKNISPRDYFIAGRFAQWFLP